MSSDNKTPERPRRPAGGPAVKPRPAQTNRPVASDRPRTSAPLSQPPGKGPRPKRSSWKTLWENIGWGLLIGLPVILVILAIAFRATNGFQGTPNNAPLPTPAPTATPGQFVAPPANVSGNKDRLLFIQAADATNPMQLYSAVSDGKNPVQLTNTKENKATPAWSPDGKQVVFSADGVGIQLVNFDGSGLHTVAYGGFNPLWSPDGKQIAFLKNAPAADGQGPDRTGTVRILYVTPVNGKPGDERQLTADVLGHNWSPDGKQLAFFSLRNAVMFTVEVETAKVEQIKLGQSLGGWYPTFAPDGASLVFYGNPNPATMVAALDLAVASSNTEAGVTTPTANPLETAAAALTTQAAVPGTTTVSGPSGTTTPAASGTAGAGTTPGAATAPALTPTPTAVPGSPSQMSLYQVNRDGSGLKKLQDLEPGGGTGGGKYAFNYYIATSADQIGVLSARPFFKVGPAWAPDGKSVAALYIGQGDRVGLALVRTDGAPTNLLVEGQNNLEPGVRLNPSFASNSRLLYSYVPPRPAAGAGTPVPGGIAGRLTGIAKQVRAFDTAGNAEQTVVGQQDNSFLVCCGFARS